MLLQRCFSTDFAEIRLPLSTDSLPFVHLPGEGADTIEAVLTDSLNIADEHSWNAIRDSSIGRRRNLQLRSANFAGS